MSNNKRDDKGSGGGGNRIANLIADAGKSLSGKEVQQIAKQTGYAPQSIINRAEKADVNVQSSAQNFVKQAIQAQTASEAGRATSAAPAGTTPSFTYTPGGTIASVTYNPIAPAQSSSSGFETPFDIFPTGAATDPLKGTSSLSEVEAANKLALGQIQKQIAALQEAGATERVKYEVDNRIPLTQAESKGKIDLQKIVNAGYQNIARIERGSDMFRSIMGAFNF